jgi:hypothetical protein
MAQGTRVSQNLFHENASEDLFVEVNHGPFLVDNNLFLSPTSLLDMSEGGAYAHNLFAGRIISRPELSRETPYHPAHSTKVAGLVNVKGGDDRFYNNLFVGQAEAGAEASKATQASAGYGLSVYDARELPLSTGGNVYYNSARPYVKETNAVVFQVAIDRPALVETDGHVFLRFQFGPQSKQADTVRVTSELLGKAMIPNLPYENPDGSPLVSDSDYFCQGRNLARPRAGPFEAPGEGLHNLKVW